MTIATFNSLTRLGVGAALFLFDILRVIGRRHRVRGDRSVVGDPGAEHRVELFVEAADLPAAGAAAAPDAVLGQRVFPLQPLDADAALLWRADVTLVQQLRRDELKDVAVPQLLVQGRLHVVLAPHGDQRQGLGVRPQGAAL